MFQDEALFDPERDGKIPVRRSPMALVGRSLQLVLSMLFSRHPEDLLRWLRSMYQRRRPLSYALPWLTFDATREISRRLSPGARVFEFGSGHSTPFWAQLGATVYSVEDHPDWFGLVKQRLAAHPGAHVYLEPEQAGYLARIEQVGGLFDMVLVDGSYRKECLAPAIRYLKPGGLLVVDNTDWHWFDDVDMHVPKHWQRLTFNGWAPFIGHRSETSIWICDQ